MEGAISTITDAVCEAVLEWQHRPLEAFYPVIYLDAIRIKVRRDHRVENRAAHLAVGVDMDSVKHVLGIWVQADEGAAFWAHVCAEPANRGVRDVLRVSEALCMRFNPQSRRRVRNNDCCVPEEA